MAPPRRAGRPLGIVLIVVQKSVWALVLLLVSVTLLWFHARHLAEPIRVLFPGELLEDPHGRLADLLIRLVPRLSPRTELLLGAGAAVYAALEIVEAWGLWRLILWVELLTVVETSAFFPYELREMSRRPSIPSGLALAINVLVVAYLVVRYRRKRARHPTEGAERPGRRVDGRGAGPRRPPGE
jgi:uncharacterized membrane protein (DUF2068 family)